jgi:hypothetical protein
VFLGGENILGPAGIRARVALAFACCSERPRRGALRN